MKKSIIAMIALAVCSYTGIASATMASNSVLSFYATDSVPVASTVAPVGLGSMFGASMSPTFEWWTAISSDQGIVLGTTQTPGGSHSGAPDGTESPTIDNPWEYFASTGMHGTTSPITITSDDGEGNVTLDMSGWFVDWNSAITLLGTGADAIVTCIFTCEIGETYILDYTVTIPGTGGCFCETWYALHLEGTISAPSTVPVPAAVWLMASGLVGLVGVARRKARS